MRKWPDPNHRCTPVPLEHASDCSVTIVRSRCCGVSVLPCRCCLDGVALAVLPWRCCLGGVALTVLPWRCCCAGVQERVYPRDDSGLVLTETVEFSRMLETRMLEKASERQTEAAAAAQAQAQVRGPAAFLRQGCHGGMPPFLKGGGVHSTYPPWSAACPTLRRVCECVLSTLHPVACSTFSVA